MQERVKRGASQDIESDNEPVGTDSDAGTHLNSDLDDLLDDIDEVLEENAEEFVKNYVQKGGQ